MLHKYPSVIGSYMLPMQAASALRAQRAVIDNLYYRDFSAYLEENEAAVAAEEDYDSVARYDEIVHAYYCALAYLNYQLGDAVTPRW